MNKKLYIKTGPILFRFFFAITIIPIVFPKNPRKIMIGGKTLFKKKCTGIFSIFMF